MSDRVLWEVRWLIFRSHLVFAVYLLAPVALVVCGRSTHPKWVIGCYFLMLATPTLIQTLTIACSPLERFERHCREKGTTQEVGAVLRILAGLNRVCLRGSSAGWQERAPWEAILVALVQRPGTIELNLAESAALADLLGWLVRPCGGTPSEEYAAALVVLATESGCGVVRGSVEQLAAQASFVCPRIADAVADYRLRVRV